MFCVIKSMRVISNKFEFKNWLLVFWTSDSKIYPNLRSRTTYQNRGIPDGGCILFYGKESIRTSCQANGCIFLFFRNFGRDFLMIIFLKWFLVFFQENEDCLKSPFHVVISGSVKIRRSGNFSEILKIILHNRCDSTVRARARWTGGKVTSTRTSHKAGQGPSSTLIKSAYRKGLSSCIIQSSRIVG